MTKIAVQLPPYRNPGGVVPEQINVREVLSCWRTLFEPGKDLDRLYETLVTISAPAMARGFYRMRAHPNGRKLFENKPNILARLEDDDYLASLPAGTVGHAFRSFLATNRLDAGVYNEAVIRPIAQKNNWSEDYYYSVLRGTALHDVLHAITGYGPDAAGEAMALGFYCGQTETGWPDPLGGPHSDDHHAGSIACPQTALLSRSHRAWQARRQHLRSTLGRTARPTPQ